MQMFRGVVQEMCINYSVQCIMNKVWQFLCEVFDGKSAGFVQQETNLVFQG